MEEKQDSNNNDYSLFSFPSSKVISAIGVDESGTQIALAGKQGLYIVDVNNPLRIKRTLTIPAPSSSAREQLCKNVLWNPHPDKKSLIATSNGKNINLWDVGSNYNRGGVLSTISSHTRTVQGISWNLKDENLLASCSLDTYINVWDIRTPRNSVKFRTFCSWTDGGIDVKWNRLNGMILASCHSGEVRVWDIRKETTPLTFITAHNNKINNIDWSYTREHDLLTCGQDRKVKFWNVTMPRVTKATIKSSVSAIYSRYTPVGEGVITIEKENNSIKLWKLADLSSVVHTYTGHNDAIVSFDFAVNKENSTCQIVTFSRDNQLGFWNISPGHQKSIGHYSRILQKEQQSDLDDSSTIPLLLDCEYDSISTLKLTPNVGLIEEFSLLDAIHFPNIEFAERNIEERRIIFAVSQEKDTIVMQIKVSEEYPCGGEVPSFTILSSSLPSRIQPQILQKLNEISQKIMQTNRPCIDHCLNYIEKFINIYHSRSNNLSNSSSNPIENSNLNNIEFSSINNIIFATENSENQTANETQKKIKKKGREERYELPCPRLAGAVFTMDSRLVYFQNFFFLKNIQPPQTYDGLLSVLEDNETNLSNSPNSSATQSDDFGFPHVNIYSYYYSDDNYNQIHTTSESSFLNSLNQFNTNNMNVNNMNNNSNNIIDDSQINNSDNIIINKNEMRNNNHYANKTKRKTSSNTRVMFSNSLCPYVFDISLATKLTLSGKLTDICNHNIKIASQFRRNDLEQTWSLISLTLNEPLFLSPPNENKQLPEKLDLSSQQNNNNLIPSSNLIISTSKDKNKENQVLIKNRKTLSPSDIKLIVDEKPTHHQHQQHPQHQHQHHQHDLLRATAPNNPFFHASTQQPTNQTNSNINNNNNNNLAVTAKHARKHSYDDQLSTSPFSTSLPDLSVRLTPTNASTSTNVLLGNHSHQNDLHNNTINNHPHHHNNINNNINNYNDLYNKYNNQLVNTKTNNNLIGSQFSKPIIDWTIHPFGTKLIHSIFEHYENLKDLQTLGILSCLLTTFAPPSFFAQPLHDKSSPDPVCYLNIVNRINTLK